MTFRSSDKVLFKIHGKYLEATSAGLAPPQSILIGEENIQLEEPSSVLEFLFQFVHPPSESERYRQPHVGGLGSDVFFAVAEAAEKYLIFGAMNTCLTRMHQLAQDYPLEILNHSCKHGYKNLADRVAPYTLSCQPGDVATKLTAAFLLQRWVLYYDRWHEICSHVNNHIWKSSRPREDCARVLAFHSSFNHQFAEKPHFIFAPLSISDLPSCTAYSDCLCHELTTLLLELAAKGLSIPQFSSISFPPSS